MTTLYPDGTPAAGDPDAARSWIEAERPNLAAVCTLRRGARLAPARHRARRDAVPLSRRGRAGRRGGRPSPPPRCPRPGPSATADAQARALSNLGRLHRRQGRLARGRPTTYRQALILYADLGERAAEALVLRNLGSVDWRLGDYRQAADHYQQAWTLLPAAG